MGTKSIKREFHLPPANSMYFPEIPGLNGASAKYKGIFSNESKGHNNLRTPSMEGEFSRLPKVGEHFSIIGESLTPGGSMRHISTSRVVSIEHHLLGQTVVFNTENSQYRLDYSKIEEV